MTDWYNFVTGRPNPGRRAPTPASRFLDAPARPPSAQPTPHLQRQGVAPGRPVVPAVRTPPARVYRYSRDQSGVPIDVAAGQSEEPFGGDFATWYNEGLDRGYVSDPAPEPDAPDNPGRAPTYENNVPIGIEGGRRNIPTRLEMGANDHAPTVPQDFAPLPREWDPERQAGIKPEFDPTREWADAERRVDERFRSGAPSVGDLFFAAVFGNRGIMGPEARVRRETQQMRDEVRNDQR